MLFLELLTLPIVIFIFKWAPSPKIGGILAGSFFVLNSTILLALSKLYQEHFKTLSYTFYAVMLFLTVSVLPILIIRLWNWEMDFHSITLFAGVKAQVLHKISEKVFLMVIIATAIDYYRAYKNRNPTSFNKNEG
jgi:hypothetical protein